jgi:hypothetical protein
MSAGREANPGTKADVDTPQLGAVGKLPGHDSTVLERWRDLIGQEHVAHHSQRVTSCSSLGSV